MQQIALGVMKLLIQASFSSTWAIFNILDCYPDPMVELASTWQDLAFS